MTVGAGPESASASIASVSSLLRTLVPGACQRRLRLSLWSEEKARRYTMRVVTMLRVTVAVMLLCYVDGGMTLEDAAAGLRRNRCSTRCYELLLEAGLAPIQQPCDCQSSTPTSTPVNVRPSANGDLASSRASDTMDIFRPAREDPPSSGNTPSSEQHRRPSPVEPTIPGYPSSPLIEEEQLPRQAHRSERPTDLHSDPAELVPNERGRERPGRRGSHEDRRHHSDRRRPGNQKGPAYNVICTSTGGYELRQYKEAVWATTVVNCSRPGCKEAGFRRIFRYLFGKNDQDVEIPVRQQMVRRQNGGEPTGYVMVSASFYLPRRFWDDPPTPRDKKISIERTSPLVFTSNTNAWLDNRTVSQHYSTLREMLEQDRQPTIGGDFAVQCYNPPWEVQSCEILIDADTAVGTPTCAPRNTEELPNGISQRQD